jgi:hypothetical protein
MARCTACAVTSRAPQDALEYLSDFSNAQGRDSGVVEAERDGDGPAGEAGEFALVAVFPGRLGGWGRT